MLARHRSPHSPSCVAQQACLPRQRLQDVYIEGDKFSLYLMAMCPAVSLRLRSPNSRFLALIPPQLKRRSNQFTVGAPESPWTILLIQSTFETTTDWTIRNMSYKLVVATIAALVAAPVHAELRSDLAKYFGADPSYLVLNIPPRPGGWPGSIYSDDMRFTIVRGDPKDTSLARGPEYNFANDIEIDLSTGIGASIAKLFNLSAETAKLTKTTLNILHARTYDLTLSQVRARFAKLPTHQRKPPGPVIVYRAYQGVVVINLTRKTSASLEGWAKLRARLIDARADAGARETDTVSINAPEPMIFAFEVAKAVDLAKLLEGLDKAVGCYGSCGAISASHNATTTGAYPQFGEASNVGAVFEWKPEKVSTLYGLERIPASVFEAANPPAKQSR